MMRRRRFLKLVGLTSLAAVIRVPFAAPLAAAPLRLVLYEGLHYRGDAAGYIYTSGDGGNTWAVHTNLGPMFSVDRLAVDRRSRLRAIIGYSGRSFDLQLAANRRSWLST